MVENAHNPAERPPEHEAEEEFHLLDGLSALGRQRKILIGVPVLTTAIAVAVAVLSAPVFVSTTVILPPQQQSTSGMTAMLGQLGGLAGAAGGLAGLKNPNEMYVGMLKSRVIGDALIKKFDLQHHYDLETMSDTRKTLLQNTAVTSGKDGMITVVVEDTDPKLAANIANAYIAELSTLTKDLAVSEAAKRRVFFERQLKATKDDLATAEIALQNVQKKTGMLQLDGQVKSIIANTAQLQAQIAAREVQLSATKTFATSTNPQVLRAQEELRSLKEQLAKLQTGGKAASGNPMIPTGQIPEVGVEYIRRVRDVKYQETMFEMLARQFEVAKVDEAKDSSLIQQLDTAEPAEKKIRPKRLLTILGGLVIGSVLGVVIAYLRDAYVRSRQSEAGQIRWKKLKASWKS
ncbi:GumC family protein [Duganella sp. Leaf126]|uniref:GumC family protein n=1 Tax=Duganella sp. Leaf126 TaxID=1736266 RepID=UPI0009E6E694|nr:Wzz/FepE/Etk N-terminal domain-containing protein [Duganella sp. Leaf126]